MTFYTYLWLREDGSPYYVGKGRGHPLGLDSIKRILQSHGRV